MYFHCLYIKDVALIYLREACLKDNFLHHHHRHPHPHHCVAMGTGLRIWGKEAHSVYVWYLLSDKIT